MIHKMFQYSHTDTIEDGPKDEATYDDDPEDDWRKMIAEEDPAEIDDEDVWCCTKTSYDI